MNDIAIRVEGLSKQYRIGKTQRYDTLRDQIQAGMTAPFRKVASMFGGDSSNDGNDGSELFWALKDVSFEVPRGSVLGVIGRNGAGKSTLLKILSRITEPTEGRVEIHGRVGSLLEVGTGFSGELSGRDNIFLNGAILGMKRAEITRKFDEIVAFAEVEKFIDTAVKYYSSGMYMRLAFAVAAHLEPEILIIDEVLAVGDAAFQKKCLGKMGDVAKHGRTILFVSHNMAAIHHLCDQGLLLNAGKVTRDGQMSDVISSYRASLENGGAQRNARHRECKGVVKFTELRVEDLNGEPIIRAVSGRPAVLVAHYRSALHAGLRHCRASFTVTDAEHNPFFLCSSELTTPGELVLPPSGVIRCVVPRLPLSRGSYHIGVFLQVGSEIQDWVDGYGILDVSDGDFYGTGKLCPPGWDGKSVLVPHQWQFAEESVSGQAVLEQR